MPLLSRIQLKLICCSFLVYWFFWMVLLIFWHWAFTAFLGVLCGLSLAMVMRSARNAWGHSPGSLLLVGSPYRHFPDRPLWFLWLQDTLQQQLLGNFEKNKQTRFISLLFTSPGGYMACPEPHSEVVGGRRDLGICHYWGWGRGASDFTGSLFIGEFKM